MKAAAIQVVMPVKANIIRVVQRVLIPLGKAAERLVHVPIFGVWGSTPMIASNRMRKPIQQAHQSSVRHKEDQSIFFFSLFINSTSFHSNWGTILLGFETFPVEEGSPFADKPFHLTLLESVK
jgi:hypothetical protein